MTESIPFFLGAGVGRTQTILFQNLSRYTLKLGAINFISIKFKVLAMCTYRICIHSEINQCNS